MARKAAGGSAAAVGMPLAPWVGMQNQTGRRRISSRRAFALGAAAILGVFLGPATLHAQINPNVVEFLPSAEHHTTLASGQPAISRYEFLVYQPGTLDPYLRVDLGKPAPQADGVIRVSFISQVAVWPLPNVASDARIAAYGPTGVGVSGVSNPFTFACSLAVSATAQTFLAAGGTGSAQVTAGAQCGWTAISSTRASERKRRRAWMVGMSGSTRTFTSDCTRGSRE